MQMTAKTAGPRRPRLLATVIGTMLITVLAILGSRFVVGDNLAFFGKVAPGATCTGTQQLDDTYCLKAVSYPDLLLQKGRQEMHLYVDGQEDGRFYTVPDPFSGDPADESLAWGENGLSITDGSLTLTWSLETLARLGA